MFTDSILIVTPSIEEAEWAVRQFKWVGFTKVRGTTPGGPITGQRFDAIFVSHVIDQKGQWFQQHVRPRLAPGGYISQGEWSNG